MPYLDPRKSGDPRERSLMPLGAFPTAQGRYLVSVELIHDPSVAVPLVCELSNGGDDLGALGVCRLSFHFGIGFHIEAISTLAGFLGIGCGPSFTEETAHVQSHAGFLV